MASCVFGDNALKMPPKEKLAALVNTRMTATQTCAVHSIKVQYSTGDLDILQTLSCPNGHKYVCNNKIYLGTKIIHTGYCSGFSTAFCHLLGKAN